MNFQHLGHQQPPRAWSLLACMNLMIVFVAVFLWERLSYCIMICVILRLVPTDAMGSGELKQ